MDSFCPVHSNCNPSDSAVFPRNYTHILQVPFRDCQEFPEYPQKDFCVEIHLILILHGKHITLVIVEEIDPAAVTGRLHQNGRTIQIKVCRNAIDRLSDSLSAVIVHAVHIQSGAVMCFS